MNFSDCNKYQVLVITLLNTILKGAICQFFKNVNIGGITANNI